MFGARRNSLCPDTSGDAGDHDDHLARGLVTVRGPVGSTVSVAAADTGSVPAPPRGESFPFGALHVNISGLTAGAVVQVVINLPHRVDGVRKLISGVWDSFTPDGTTGATISGGGTKITLSVQDGGRGDADGTADGTITDPVAPEFDAVPVAELSVASMSSCVRLSTGTVECWGFNFWGQLGNGSTTDSPVPVQVTGITDATGLSVGMASACAITASATVKCWGNNDSGQLGDGTKIGSSVPVDVVGLTDVVQVSVGTNDACAVTGDGSLYCWGSNSYGESGPPYSSEGHPSPHLVALAPVAKVVAADLHTCALLVDATVSCWGNNSYSELARPPVNEPQGIDTVAGISGATDLAAQYWTTCTIAGAVVRCWGYNTDGGGGTGSALPTALETPTVLSFPSAPLRVTAGSNPSCAGLSDGSAWCWGSDHNDGALGRGVVTPGVYSPGPVTDLGDVTDISAGVQHVCALVESGAVKCWGKNDHGQLGDGSRTDRPTPVDVAWLG